MCGRCWLVLAAYFLLLAAHTTQFTHPGFHYLRHGFGVGHLAKGGSYVTLVNPDNKTDFTIVMETMVSAGTWLRRPHSDDVCCYDMISC